MEEPIVLHCVDKVERSTAHLLGPETAAGPDHHTGSASRALDSVKSFKHS